MPSRRLSPVGHSANADDVEPHCPSCLLDRCGEGHGPAELLLERTVKTNTELGRTLVRATTATNAGDRCFPVAPAFIEPARHFASFGDGRPRFVRAVEVRDLASLRKGHTAFLPALTLGHGEGARQFRCGTRILGWLP